MYKVKLWFTGQNIEHSTTIEIQIQIDVELIIDEKNRHGADCRVNYYFFRARMIF